MENETLAYFFRQNEMKLLLAICGDALPKPPKLYGGAQRDPLADLVPILKMSALEMRAVREQVLEAQRTLETIIELLDAQHEIGSGAEPG